MNVILFPTPVAAAHEPGWRHTELQQLIALCAGRVARGSVETWEVDYTELSDPQFYLLGADRECVLCISRVHGTYILEDGTGAVLTESRVLGPVLNRAKLALARRCVAAGVTRILVVLCAVRFAVEEKLEVMFPDSMDVLARFAPELQAII